MKKTIATGAAMILMAGWAGAAVMKTADDLAKAPVLNEEALGTFGSASTQGPVLARIAPLAVDVHRVGVVDGLGPLAFVGNDLYRGCEHKAGEKGLRRIRGIAATSRP